MLKKFLLLIIGLFAFPCFANVVITGTRVIYPANQSSITVQLTNVGENPALVQAWIDNGDPNLAPEKIKTPFVITPPLARIDGKKGQILRVSYTGEPLPNDRESLFYFNLLDIPPNPKNSEQNYLQIALRSRLKLFFRPIGLSLSPFDAYEKVQWTIKGNQLLVNNPTPYYINYSTIELMQGKAKQKIEAVMLSPFSQEKLSLNRKFSGKTILNWNAINDYGGKTSGNLTLN